ncbi:MAG: EAL domain-containing protein [Clostridiales bacterium]|nr:EAL domain-containing protein [Clostridiales bacterium]
MANSNSVVKNVIKVRMNHSWITMLVFCTLSLVALVATAAFGELLTAYLIDGKVSSEYNRLSYLSSEYSKDSSSVINKLEGSKLEYVIKTDDGELISSNVPDTCGIDEIDTEFVDDIMLYNDTLDPITTVDEHTLQIRSVKLSRKLMESFREIRGFEYRSFSSDVFPLWIEFEVPELNTSIFVKYHVVLDFADLTLLAGFALITVSFIILLFITFLVSVIVTGANQKKNLKLFFMDPITRGKNWNWFIFQGDKTIKSMMNADKKYAVVHLVFLDYRNYCVCHSIQAGEVLLKKVHDLISGTLDKKEIVVRSTTSNFALLLKYQSDEQLKDRISILIKSLESISDDHDFNFQAGISLLGTDRDRKKVSIENEYNNACTARETIENSDESGIVYFDDKILEDRRWNDAVRENQKAALEAEEFEVYYQPKYDPKTDTLSGAEALIRWQSPKFGFVSPGRFIPIFEKNGFITEIDHYMVTHVAADQARWLQQGLKCVPVSVNISRAHFIESDLAEQIRDMVDKEGCPRELIEIELTESAFFDDKKALVSTITKLKDYGFSVSMDDFGSGYSSLNSLKDMPLDTLKIDAEFFRGEEAGGRGRIVVSETIQLAKNLNMKTVAEGVEDRELVDFLADNDCDMIQGYYYAKPMPGKDYEERMINPVRKVE